MSFSINTNIASLQAQNYLRINSDFQSKTINEVTSGLRIVNSGDDAAGLAVANGFRSNEAVLTQGIQNANNGLATLQTIDGGISNISQLLDRARTLATESASGTFTGDRGQLDSEFQSVLTEINRQATNIGMNQNGSFAKALSVFIGGGMDGATGSTTDTTALTNGSVSVDLSKSAVDTQSLGLTSYNATPAAAATLSTITTAGNLVGGTTMNLVFEGAGFTAGGNGTVTVSALNVNNAKTLGDVVNDINNGIATAAASAGANNQAFAKAGIQAQLSSDGTKIVFASANGGFGVTDAGDGSSTAALSVLGGVATGVPVISSGTQEVALTQPTALSGVMTQDLTISATDASGHLTQVTAHLTAGAKSAQIQAINTALQGATAGSPLKNLVALDSDNVALGGVKIEGTGAFSVFVGNASTAGDGMKSGGSQGVFANSAQNGTGGALDVATASDAQTAVNALSNAVQTLGSAQAAVGKGENNFNYAINLAQSQLTNESSAESGIRDADLAAEAANLTKAQILMQAGVAALAQANAAPQAVLSLLKG